MTDFRPRRTILYLPAANARAIEKARTLPADCVILDLEDAVAPDAKEAARAAAIAAVANEDWGQRELAIRVNALSTPWSDADFTGAATSAAHVIVVPKVNGAQDAVRAVALAGGKPVWAMIETPRAIQEVDGIADTPGVTGLIAGFNDLATELRVRPGTDRLPLIYAASRIINAARASRILAFDGVFNDIRNGAGLESEAAQALALGFDGKTCIHPDQLAIVNASFSPTPEDIAHARGLIAAHSEAMAAGKGVATFKGRMIEALHVMEAHHTLKVAEVVAEMGGLAEKVIDLAVE